MTELKQIDIFDTVFNFVEQYDPEIKKIKVYGILDENNRCKDPYFMAKDVLLYLKYLNKNPNEKAFENNFTRTFKVFKLNKEIIQRKVNINSKIERTYNCKMLTKYGLIRCISFCGNTDTKASVAFREFIYALFDAVEDGNVFVDPVLNQFHNEMRSADVQAELKKIDEEETGGIVYFIKNITTNNIKIGRTNDDIEIRLSNLQTGNDCELKVIKTIDCNKKESSSVELEKVLHQQFAEYHVRGEWYSIDEAELKFL